MPTTIAGALEFGKEAYANTPSPIKDKICFQLQKGINDLDAQSKNGKHIKRAATTQALGAVGVVTGGLVLAGIITAGAANPLLLGIGLAAVGTAFLTYGTIRTFRNIRKAHPDLPLYKQISKTCTQSFKNVFFGSIKFVLNVSDKLKTKFDTRVQRYSLNEKSKETMIIDIKNKINQLPQNIKTAQEKTENTIKKTQENLTKLKSQLDSKKTAVKEIQTKLTTFTQRIENNEDLESIKQEIKNYLEPYGNNNEQVQNLLTKLNDLNKDKTITLLKGITNSETIIKKITNTFSKQTTIIAQNIKTQGQTTIKNCQNFIKNGQFERAKKSLDFLAKVTDTEISPDDIPTLEDISINHINNAINLAKLNADPTIQNSLESLRKKISNNTLTLKDFDEDKIYSQIDVNLQKQIKKYLETQQKFYKAVDQINEKLSQDFIDPTKTLESLATQAATLEIRNAIDDQYSASVQQFSGIINTINQKIAELAQQGNKFNGLTQDALGKIELVIYEKKKNLENEFYKSIDNLDFNSTIEDLNNFKFNIENIENILSIDQDLIKNLATSVGRKIAEGIEKNFTNTLEDIAKNNL